MIRRGDKRMRDALGVLGMPESIISAMVIDPSPEITITLDQGCVLVARVNFTIVGPYAQTIADALGRWDDDR